MLKKNKREAKQAYEMEREQGLTGIPVYRVTDLSLSLSGIFLTKMSFPPSLRLNTIFISFIIKVLNYNSIKVL